jgi:hypothetical protein
MCPRERKRKRKREPLRGKVLESESHLIELSANIKDEDIAAVHGKRCQLDLCARLPGPRVRD